MSLRSPLISLEDIGRPADWRHPQVNAGKLERALHERVSGEVRFDAGSKAMYAVDGGNYRQVPIGVVVPRTIEDVVATVAICREFGAPLLSRGGGTSLAGQCCNTAIVVDWTKYLHNIVELNTAERYARVQPGVICDDLRNAAKPHGLTWGPDPATHTHCVFGGMIGNNSCGAHAQMAGKAVDNVEELDLLLYDGTQMTVGWTTDEEAHAKIQRGGREGDIYRQLLELRKQYAQLVQQKYPKIPRRVSGYNLDQLISDASGKWNLARALVGSEGTLVTVLKAKLRLVDARPNRVIVMLGYPDVYRAADHVMDVLEFDPVALEGIDEYLVHNVKLKGGPHVQYLDLLPEGKGWLLCEIGCDAKQEALDRAHRLMDKVQQSARPPSVKLFESEEDQKHIWIVRESGLGATAFVPGKPLTWEGWEDSAVAPARLGSYLRDLCSLYKKHRYETTLYGHFGQGCVHCRINFDFRSEQGIRNFRAFIEEATDLVTRYGGSISGEHGDGQSKAEFLYKMFGKELIEAFREYKSIWDPDWKMNPGRIVDPDHITENLRIANYPQWEPKTHFQFPDDQGKFSNAALRCVGVGKCRRIDGQSVEDNTMCPSFVVTREEAHSTRGRAHQLWEMLQGEVIHDGWRDENVKGALDLCLACKGCKGDCPVNVDIATYKAEFLAHYFERRLRPRSAYAFGLIDQWARLASVVPGLVNLATQTPVLREVAKLVAGMPGERKIPAFAPQTFKNWFRKREPRNHGAPEVVLWADTFNNYFFPETAQAAVEVLESAGYRVRVPMQHLCCGRPLYDFGMLARAKRYLNNVLDAMDEHIARGTPMIVLEPSCCSVFRDEMRGLLPESPRANMLRENTFLFSEFLEKKAHSYRFPTLRRRAIVQGHCHHQALMRMGDEISVMQKMGLEAEVLHSGCCGMAGSFGFEKEKYEVSVQCGERSLLPAVRQASPTDIIMANGFSCREQIAQGTQRHALHLAEVLEMAMRDNSHTEAEPFPEKRVVKARQSAVRRSMWRTAASLAGIGVVTFALWRRMIATR